MGTSWHKPRSHPSADGTLIRYDDSALYRRDTARRRSLSISMKFGSQIVVLENMENEAAA